jgi:hypothetical protein
MKVDYLHEPELQFGVDKHIDIKFGLMNYGPLDFDSPLSPQRIKLGIVGTPETIEGVMQWLEKCRMGISAKTSKRPNLFPRFPGFGNGMRLAADFVLDSQLQRSIPQSRFDDLCHKPKTHEVLEEIAQLFLDELEYLVEKTTAEVLVCAFPFALVEFLDQDDDGGAYISDDDEADGKQDTPIISSKMIFHDYLKAKAMRFRKPTQIIRPATYDDRKHLKQKHPSGEPRRLQDEATRAWNF